MRRLILPASLLLVLFTAILLNVYLLHRELQTFYISVVKEETNRVKSVVEGVLAGGGDPVEALVSYISSSKLLKGATFNLEGREIIVPGSDISPNYYRKTVKLKPFTFTLYFDFSYIEEFNRHLTYILVSLLSFSFLFTLVTLWLFMGYYRGRISYEREKQERERLESINLVIHSLIHEVKNRLNVLKLLSYRLETSFSQEHLKRLKNEMDNLGRYLEETADLRKPLTLKKTKTSAKQIIDAAVSRFEELFKVKNVELQLNVEDAQLLVDPERLTSLLTDLLKNAIEALEGKEKKVIRIVAKREGNTYSISVMDSGGELPQKDLFKPFYSTKKKGFGLGLYNARRITEAHGGKIEAFVKDGWTVFRVELPLN